MGAALCRLIEQGQPPASRLFNDPVVGRLLDPRTVAMADGPMRELYLTELGSGTCGAQVMRTRYIDDVVTGLVEGGTTQVVILGGEVPGLLDSYGLSLVDDVGEAEFRSRYAEPLGRRLELYDVEHVAFAVVRAA